MAVRIPLNSLNAFQATLRDVTIGETHFAPVHLVFLIGGPNDLEYPPNPTNRVSCLSSPEQLARHFVDNDKCAGSNGSFKRMA